MKNKITLLNMLSSMLLQLCTIISGFIIPRIILSFFGSNVNGLLSSITQFLSYISLVEGGVGAVVLANLYKPLVENDDKKISLVMSTANRFYKTIGTIFIVYSIVMAVAYPLFFAREFSYGYVFSLILIISLGTTIQYMFAINARTLLNADKKIYIVSFTQIVCVVINLILVIVSVKVYPSVHLLKLITSLIYLVQPIFYNWYIRKHYTIAWNGAYDHGLLKERWNGFAINTAAFIHNCTDVVILTIFTDLGTVSIYAVYSLITNGIKQLIVSFINGINPTIGQAYAKGDLYELNEKMDLYEFVVMISTFFFYTMTALLITPFVMLYTQGVTDANYNQPLLGITLVLAELFYIVKFPHLNLAYSANKFKELTVPAYIEVGLNIVISIFFVYKIGIVGVVVGTLVAMIYRMMFHVYYTGKLIVGRRQWIFYKKLLVFLLEAIGIVLFCYRFFPIKDITAINWILHACLYAIIVVVIMFGTARALFKKEIKFCYQYLRKRM